jgi:serine/threonine-protein kinase RsbW
VTKPKTGDLVTESWQPGGLDDGPDEGGTAADVRAPSVFSRAYPAVPRSVAAVRSAVGDFAAQAGAPQSTVDGIKLAVSEAATNVIVHAYPDRSEPGLIHVEAARAGGELRISVADTGPGLRTGRESPGLGLGLAIIGSLADKVELLQGGDGLHVLMRFALPADPTDP